MSKHIKEFKNESEYQAFKESAEYAAPNLSWCVTENTIKSEALPTPPDTRLVANYNVTGTTSATKLQSGLTSNIASMEIDGVELDTPVTAYTFDTVGEHTVKYTLTDNTIIGRDAFSGCGNLSSVTIGSGVTSIGEYAFGGCTSLSSVTIPDSVTSIGESAFVWCVSLSSITIPDSVTSIGDGAFKSCSSLSSITISNGVTSIGDDAFNNCTSLPSITIPDSVTSIGNYAFSSCQSLSSVIIGSGVTSIGENLFGGCTSLSSITIPDSVTSIGGGAFMSCTNLSSITYTGTQAQWAQMALGSRWHGNVPATVVHCSDGDVTL